MKQSFQFYATCSQDLSEAQILKDLLKAGMTGICLNLTEDPSRDLDLAELIFRSSRSMRLVPEFLVRITRVPGEESSIDRLISGLESLLPFGPTGILLSGVEDQKTLIRWNKLLLARGLSQIRLAAGISSLKGIDSLMHLLPWCRQVVLERNLLAENAPAASLPVLQKKAAAVCNAGRTGLTVCDAFLPSLLGGSEAIPAEINDAAAAVFDGSAGIMLSEADAEAGCLISVMELLDQIVYEAMRYRDTGTGLPFSL